MLGMFAPSESFIARGEEKVEKAVEIYNKFFSAEAPERISDYYMNDVI
jgi:hypothetical protein